MAVYGPDNFREDLALRNQNSLIGRLIQEFIPWRGSPRRGVNVPFSPYVPVSTQEDLERREAGLYPQYVLDRFFGGPGPFPLSRTNANDFFARTQEQFRLKAGPNRGIAIASQTPRTLFRPIGGVGGSRRTGFPDIANSQSTFLQRISGLSPAPEIGRSASSRALGMVRPRRKLVQSRGNLGA